MNSCNFVGTVTSNIELRNYQKDNKTNYLVSFTLQVKNDVGSQYLPIMAFGEPAQRIAQYVHKDDRIGLTCEATTKSIKTEDGYTRSLTTFVVNKIDLSITERLDSCKIEDSSTDVAFEDSELPF